MGGVAEGAQYGDDTGFHGGNHQGECVAGEPEGPAGVEYADGVADEFGVAVCGMGNGGEGVEMGCQGGGTES